MMDKSVPFINFAIMYSVLIILTFILSTEGMNYIVNDFGTVFVHCINTVDVKNRRWHDVNRIDGRNYSDHFPLCNNCFARGSV